METTRNAFAYVFAGAGTFRDASEPQAVLTESAVDPNAQPVYDAKNHSLVLFDRGDEIVVQAGPEGIRFLLVSGKPLEEPVAWYGPIVMNTAGRAAPGHGANCRTEPSSVTDKTFRPTLLPESLRRVGRSFLFPNKNNFPIDRERVYKVCAISSAGLCRGPCNFPR